ERLERPLDHFAYRADQRGDLLLRVFGTRVSQLLDQPLCTMRAVDEQSGDASDDRAQRQIFDHLLVSAKARRKKTDDSDRGLGVAFQKLEQLARWNEDDGALRNRNGVSGLGLIVEHRDVGEGAARPEHFQHLLAALRGGGDGPYATAENDAESFGRVALPKD